MSNLIECSTCGYPLTPEERTTLVEVNGKMQKPWVGLTDEEVASIYMNHTDRPMYEQWKFARAIEAKLKEKNT